MGLIKRSKNSIWRVWSGRYSTGPNKKKAGATIALTLRFDKKKFAVSEKKFIQAASKMLRKYAAKYDPE